MRMQTRTRPIDFLIAEQAGRQYGVVSRSQLLELGLSADAIGRRIRLGRLHRLHRGVYAVGHQVVSQEGGWLAAILACEPDAVLSHRSAASLWGLVRGDRRRSIDVTLPRKTGSTGSIRRHCGQLAADEIAIRRGIRVTSLPRTLLDYASVSSGEALEAAVREVEYLHRVRPELLLGFVARHSGARGVAKLRESLVRLGEGPRGRVRSRLELRFAALLTRTGLPRPALNAVVDLDGLRMEVDCLWRSQRLIVELDGVRAHGTASARANDRHRDRLLRAAGWRVERVNWREVEEPEALIHHLRRFLNESAFAGEYRI
jgi:hypothetical protein